MTTIYTDSLLFLHFPLLNVHVSRPLDTVIHDFVIERRLSYLPSSVMKFNNNSLSWKTRFVVYIFICDTLDDPCFPVFPGHAGRTRDVNMFAPFWLALTPPQHTLKILDKEKELKRVTREGGREEEKKGASWIGVQYLTCLRKVRNPEEKSKEGEKARSHLGEQQAFKYSAMRRSRVAILVLMTFYHCLGQRDDEKNIRLSSQSLFVADYVAFYGIKQVCLLGEGEW